MAKKPKEQKPVKRAMDPNVMGLRGEVIDQPITETLETNSMPYVMTVIVLIFTSLRNSKDKQPPASLGLPYFREDR